jgi:hypothetical protein
MVRYLKFWNRSWALVRQCRSAICSSPNNKAYSSHKGRFRRIRKPIQKQETYTRERQAASEAPNRTWLAEIVGTTSSMQGDSDQHNSINLRLVKAQFDDESKCSLRNMAVRDLWAVALRTRATGSALITRIAFNLIRTR